MAGSTISSWFDFPFLEKANHALSEAVGLSWLGGKEVHDFHHVWMALKEPSLETPRTLPCPHLFSSSFFYCVCVISEEVSTSQTLLR